MKLSQRMLNNMEDRFKEIIHAWAQEEFGNSNALPEPVLNSMAEYIFTRHDWEIYNTLKDKYTMEDVEDIAEQDDIELTEEEKKWIVEKFNNTDTYQSSLDILMDIVNYCVERRKEKSLSNSSSAENKQQQ